MIRNETEYQEAMTRLAEERNRLTEHRARLKQTGLTDEEIKRVTDPMESFHLQLKEEVGSYGLLKASRSETWRSGLMCMNRKCLATNGTSTSASRWNGP